MVDNIHPPHHCTGQLYTVKAGDTLYLIGQRYGLTVQQIVSVNPQISNPNVIYVGQVICIPTAPQPDGPLTVLSLRFLTETGQPLPIVDGAVQLIPELSFGLHLTGQFHMLTSFWNLPVQKPVNLHV